MTDDRRPTTDDRRPTTDDRRPTTDDRRPIRFAPRHSIGIFLIGIAACTVPNPNYRRPHSDAGIDGPTDDSGVGADASVDAPPAEPPPIVPPPPAPPPPPPAPACTANQFLRCEDTKLVRCNAQGSAEVSESCALGCRTAEQRCANFAPSNGLASFLDQASGEADLDLGDSATINTDTGEVTVGGAPVAVRSEILAQAGAPTIRVLIVRSLTANNVSAFGTNALAVSASGELKINGVFRAAAGGYNPGVGDYSDPCRGKGGPGKAGAGGGGFGSSGGPGGGTSIDSGGVGGSPVGNITLTPLRGGCSGGNPFGGGAGGAIQLVSGTQIVVVGTIAANGGSGFYGGGGSGGGILLEAPKVQISGGVVANGGSGYGCRKGEEARLDATPALGGSICFDLGDNNRAEGGNGATGTSGATAGGNPALFVVYGGSGGGGVGRIRINTAPGGLQQTGVFSPTATGGLVATR